MYELLSPRHGVGRTEFHLFSDDSLCFKGILDSLALQLKKRRQEQLAKQNQNKGTAYVILFTLKPFITYIGKF